MTDGLTFFLISLPEEIAVIFLTLSIAGIKAESRLRRFLLTGSLLAVAFFLAFKYLLPFGLALEVAVQVAVLAAVLRFAWMIPLSFALIDSGITFTFLLALQAIFVAMVPLFLSFASPFRESLPRYLLAWLEICIILGFSLAIRRLSAWSGSARDFSTALRMRLGGWKAAAFSGQVIFLVALLGVNLNTIMDLRLRPEGDPASTGFLVILTSLTLLFGVASLVVYLIVIKEISAREESQRVLEDLVAKLPGIVYRRRGPPSMATEYAHFGSLDLAERLPPAKAGVKGVSWRDLVLPDDRPAFESALSLAAEGSGDYSVEYRLDVSGEQPFWVWDRGTTVRAADGGDVVMEGYASDISARKIAEEGLAAANREKECLVRELFHRTGNSMQVISSMMRLRAAASGEERIESMFADISLRVDALSIAQDALRASRDLSTLDLGFYITDLVDSLVFRTAWLAGVVRPVLDLESATISIDDAGSLGLVLTELLLNAARYAAAGREGCGVTIKSRLEGSGWIRIEFEDDGPGLPEGFDLGRLRSLGLPLAASLVRDQLKGEFDLSKGPGLRCLVRFPSVYERRI